MTLRPVPLVLGLTALAAGLLALVQPPVAAAGDGGDARADLLAEGEQLYVTGCASCHGVDGRGVRIVDDGPGPGEEITGPADGPGELRGPSLRASGAAAAYYYLTTGRMPLSSVDDQPARKEPAYTDEQIDALVAYVAQLGDGPPVPEVDIEDADVAVGGELFRANCQACHSAFGSGGALSYGRAAPNLHSSQPTEVAAAVRVGPGEMPVFGPDAIDDAELDDLAAYVEYLRSPRNEGGLQIGRNGPVPEGFVIWLFGIGGLLLVIAWIGRRAPAADPREEVS